MSEPDWEAYDPQQAAEWRDWALKRIAHLERCDEFHRKQIAEKAQRIEQQRTALQNMLTVHGWLMKGVGGIAVPDYQLLNEAPIRAQELAS